MNDQIPEEQVKLVATFKQDRWLAHQFLFKKRRPLESPKFHEEMVELFKSPLKKIAMMAFRDGAKSTNAEEEIVLGALYGEFKNCIIIGSSSDRAVDRLRSIKNEIANNERIINVYGNQVGNTWAETKIELKSGVVIQAFGREQSLRGCKHLDERPDFCLMDDLEDEETAKDLKTIARVMKWVMKVLIPTLQPSARIRMIGTPLHPKCVIVQLSADPEWTSKAWPIKYLGTNGWESMWAAKFPLAEIDRMEAAYRRVGELTSFNQEYMLKAEDEEAKPFKEDMVRVVPQVRQWQPTWACYDPSRTTNVRSAQTGKAVWSWIGTKLVIWKASGHFWMPNEIIDDIMQTNRQFNPVGIGVEKEGLEEFIMQPLRQAMAKTQEILPLVKITAPPGKNEFIKSLQPFFIAGEVELAEEMPGLVEQLLAFPSGLKDILNALAYALKMRPGRPIYEDFTDRHVFDSSAIRSFPGRPYWLCLNADDGIVTGLLCQLENGCLRIFGDYVREGEMPEMIKDIITCAALEAEGRLKIISAPKPMDPYSSTGMRMVEKQKNVTIRKGLPPEKGREHLRTMLRTMRTGKPEVMVATSALWTLKSLSGGYALGLDGVAIDGHYRLLMEGLESFTALMKVGHMSDQDSSRHYSTGRDGRQYLSSLPSGRA